MNKNLSKLLIFGAISLVIILIVITIWRGQEAAERATVTIDDQVLAVRIADNVWERRQGLSGLEAKEVKAQGMLFVFDQARVQDFWMKGMQLDLDVVWIREGKIVGLEHAVPAPAAGEAPAKFSSAPVLVDMVLELPAGYIDVFGLVGGLSLKVDLP